jgi:hypothetical protein
MTDDDHTDEPEITPSSAGQDLHDLAMGIRYELTAAQGKLTELMRQIGALKLADRLGVTCPRCGLPLPGPRVLAEHIYQIHAGPLPDHWKDGDRLVAAASASADSVPAEKKGDL